MLLPKGCKRVVFKTCYSVYFPVPESPIPWKGKVRVSETQVHTVNIVLPVHANHHGTTFGGQACLASACSVHI